MKGRHDRGVDHGPGGDPVWIGVEAFGNRVPCGIEIERRWWFEVVVEQLDRTDLVEAECAVTVGGAGATALAVQGGNTNTIFGALTMGGAGAATPAESLTAIERSFRPCWM